MLQVRDITRSSDRVPPQHGTWHGDCQRPLSFSHIALELAPLRAQVAPDAGPRVDHQSHDNRCGDDNDEILNGVNHHCEEMEPPLTCGTIHELLACYLAHFWRLVRLEKRKATSLDHYCSLTGIVPSGFDFTPRRKTSNFSAIADLSPEQLSTAVIQDWMLELAEDIRDNRPNGNTGITTANRCLTLLDSALKWAIKRGAIPAGVRAATDVETFSETPRTRYLEPHEAHSVFAALASVERARLASTRKEHHWYVYSPTRALQLIMLTGMRLCEAMHLRVEHVDLRSGVIKLPDSKTGYSEVALSSHTISLLREQLRFARDGWVFPSKRGGPIQTLSHVWRTALDVSGIDQTGVVIHTARHTMASLLKVMGTPMEEIQRVLRHKKRETTETAYTHVTLTDAVYRAVEAYGRMIHEASPVRGTRGKDA